MGAGLLARRFVCIGPGGLRLQPPAPRAGWRGGGRTGAQSALALAEQGTGEGGQEAGGSGAAGGGCINREGGTCILGWVRGGELGTKKVESLQRWAVRARDSGAHVQGRGRRGPPKPSSSFLFFFCKRRGGVVGIAPSFSSPQG